jgi:hypothetical protein
LGRKRPVPIRVRPSAESIADCGSAIAECKLKIEVK